MHANFPHEQIVIFPILALLMLVAGGIGLCVLFFFKRTRPLAWTLLGLGVFGLMVLVSYTWLSVRHERIAPVASPTPPAQDWSHSAHKFPTAVDIDALLGPRIQLDGQTVVMGRSAHPTRPAPPLEVKTVEAAPPEPQDIDDAEPVSDDYNTAAPSDSVSASSSAAGSFPRAGGGESSPPDAASRSSAGESPPDWKENPPPRDPQNYPVVITTDPFISKHEADRQVNQLMMIATSEVVSDLVGVYGPHYPNSMDYDQDFRYQVALEHLRGMDLTPGYLRSKIWRDEWVEHLDLDLPSGEMLRVHTLLEFDDSFQTELQNRWREHQAHQRLGILGMIAAGVVGLLAVVWGTLTFDTATKGYYTKWLVAGAVLVTMAVGFLVIAVA